MALAAELAALVFLGPMLKIFVAVMPVRRRRRSGRLMSLMRIEEEACRRFGVARTQN